MVPLLELPQGGEWVVILVIVVLLFGAKKLPDLTRNVARAMVEFKKAAGGEDESPSLESQENPQQTAPQQPAAVQSAAAQQGTAPATAPRTEAGDQQGSAGRVDLEGGGAEGVREERDGL